MLLNWISNRTKIEIDLYEDVVGGTAIEKYVIVPFSIEWFLSF